MPGLLTQDRADEPLRAESAKSGLGDTADMDGPSCVLKVEWNSRNGPVGGDFLAEWDVPGENVI